MATRPTKVLPTSIASALIEEEQQRSAVALSRVQQAQQRYALKAVQKDYALEVLRECVTESSSYPPAPNPRLIAQRHLLALEVCASFCLIVRFSTRVRALTEQPQAARCLHPVFAARSMAPCRRTPESKLKNSAMLVDLDTGTSATARYGATKVPRRMHGALRYARCTAQIANL